MRRLQAKLRLIEDILEHIENPRRNFDKTISPTAKTKELKALSEMIFQTQKLVDELDDPTARHVYQCELDEKENQRRELLNPTFSLICNC